jgi:hypothetical protein
VSHSETNEPFEIEPYRCPGCNGEIAHGIGVGHGLPPDPGDYLVCSACGVAVVRVPRGAVGGPNRGENRVRCCRVTACGAAARGGAHRRPKLRRTQNNKTSHRDIYDARFCFSLSLSLDRAKRDSYGGRPYGGRPACVVFLRVLTCMVATPPVTSAAIRLRDSSPGPVNWHYIPRIAELQASNIDVLIGTLSHQRARNAERSFDSSPWKS